MTRERILFRADASHAMGFGHLARTAALIEEAANAGFEPIGLFGGDVPAVQRWAQSHSIAADVRAWTPDEAARLAAGTDVRALFVDGPAIAGDLLPALPDKVRAVLVDDVGSDAAVATVVNHNIHASELPYPGARHRLLGRRFLMLRADIRRYMRGSASAVPQRGKRLHVLVTFGGSDPVNATSRVVATLPPDRALDVTVIAGPGFRGHDSLTAAVAAATANGHRLDVVSAPLDPGALFIRAHAAICSAGGTLGELAFLGCPALGYAIARDQLGPARKQVREGLIAGGRRWSDLDDDTLRGDLLRFVLDDDGRRAQRERALASVDADGSRRVIREAVE